MPGIVAVLDERVATEVEHAGVLCSHFDADVRARTGHSGDGRCGGREGGGGPGAVSAIGRWAGGYGDRSSEYGEQHGGGQSDAPYRCARHLACSPAGSVHSASAFRPMQGTSVFVGTFRSALKSEPVPYRGPTD